MTRESKDADQGNTENVSPSEIARVYRGQVVAWAAAAGDPKRANGLLREHQRYYKEIRHIASGRQAILSLLEDAEPAVRLIAATHALLFDPDQAVPVLEDLQQQQAGPYSFDALMTLRQFEAGRLNLNW